ncbi:DNA methyltransferase [Lacrimispora xylanisolvens]|uniref:DNA methyltransferase n=1 Tax=Lacrimispora xylanisolvens TaxID=384636 RepID=UPI00240273B0
MDKLEKSYKTDIEKLDVYKIDKTLFSNRDFCFNGDCRKLIIQNLRDEEIDLVITSPPYLNSRDYTDTYMVELRVLGYLKTKEDVKKLRNETIRSHVQIRWEDEEILDNLLLRNTIDKINEHRFEFWNKSLPQMIAGYFWDINEMFKNLYTKMSKGGLIFFNVANSSYYNVEIKVDLIVSQIAEKNGFHVKEIREARRINPSSQQKDNIEFLRESVIVIIKPM